MPGDPRVPVPSPPPEHSESRSPSDASGGAKAGDASRHSRAGAGRHSRARAGRHPRDIPARISASGHFCRVVRLS